MCAALGGFKIAKESPRSVETVCLTTKLHKKNLEEAEDHFIFGGNFLMRLIISNNTKHSGKSDFLKTQNNSAAIYYDLCKSLLSHRIYYKRISAERNYGGVEYMRCALENCMHKKQC